MSPCCKATLPQGLKPTLVMPHLRRPSAALRAGFKAAPFQNSDLIRGSLALHFSVSLASVGGLLNPVRDTREC
jgi:hypothetical protein